MDEDVRTLWCGNLSERVTEEILYELFLQGGPVQRVCIPKDRDGKQRTYGFITYKHINSVAYALDLFEGTLLFNRIILISTRNNMRPTPKVNIEDQYLNPNQLLQMGQQLLLGNNPSQMKMVMFGANMLPSTTPRSRHTDNPLNNDDRRSTRSHPYQREQTESNNHHKDYKPRNTHNNHRSRSTHNNHRPSNYSRRDYKSSRRNYR